MIKSRIRAASIHLILCMVIAAISGIVIFGIWYPLPYPYISGGIHLFLMLIGIDVICGPLLIAVVFNAQKSKKELRTDISVVVMVQIVVFLYGIYTIALARPVALVFEIDRFVTISASQFNLRPAEISPQLPWGRPVVRGTREPRDSAEQIESIGLSLQGISPSSMPSWWQDYESNRDSVIKRMKKIDAIFDNLNEGQRSIIRLVAKKHQKNLDSIYYIPLVSKKIIDEWSVLLDKNGEIIDYVPIDGFQ